MTTGTLAKWLVGEGDQVNSGDVIAEIETDKATMEVEAVDEGTLARILIPEGTEGVKVNAPIARLAGEGEAPAPKAEAPKAAEAPKVEAPKPAAPSQAAGETGATTKAPPAPVAAPWLLRATACSPRRWPAAGRGAAR